MAVASLVACILAISLVPAGAFVATTITIDGDMADWTPVFGGGVNTVSDGQGADDPDNPGTSSRDLDRVSATWDANYLYVYLRRTITGSNAVNYVVYIDRDGDGKLENTDMVVRYAFSGSTFQEATLTWYAPSAPAGDPIGGNGVKPAGTTGAAVAGASVTAAGAANGIEIEGRISWASLGVVPDSPMRLHFSIGLKSPIPGAIEDNTGILDLRRIGVVVTPDLNYGTASGSPVWYTHTVQNSGNATDTFALTVASSQGWPVACYLADGVTTTSSVTLGAGATMTIRVKVSPPAGTQSGTEDVTGLQAVSAADTRVLDQATDITFVGAVTVTPPRTGSMAAGGTMRYTHTVRNNTPSAGVILLTAQSSRGWTSRIYSATGGSQISSASLASGEATDIVVAIDVPAGASLGTVDSLTVRASLASDPTTFSTAIDTTTVGKLVSIVPNNSGASGPGGISQYTHKITNSWSATRSVDITATSNQGWPITLVAEDGVTQVTSVTVGPYGGTRTITVRMAIPLAAAAGTVDTTTVQVRYSGVLQDSATDRTVVGNLATYADPGYAAASASFHPSDTVFARGMGLAGGSQVCFRWLDPSGATVYTSPLIGVDVMQMANSEYVLPSAASLGTWTCVLLDKGGAEIARMSFAVSSPSWTTLTIDGGAIDFGALDPGMSSAIHSVSVIVGASGPYMLSKTTSGDVGAMGLSVTGSAGGLKPGSGMFSDNLQATPSWTATPGVGLDAIVQYTVILQ